MPGPCSAGGAGKPVIARLAYCCWSCAGCGNGVCLVEYASSMFPVRSRERTVRNHFKHSVELVDREGEIADVLAAVEDFLLARATYEAARQRWPKEHIRLRQETRIVEDGSDPH